MTEETKTPPEHTLKIDVQLDAPLDAVWRCWTEPDQLAKWYCPKPWHIAAADFDFRPGGRMNLVMQGPNGERIETTGIWLAIEPKSELVFTDYYHEGYIPQPTSFMTGFVRLSENESGGTRMIWGARHTSEEDVQKHIEMGFEWGWGTAARQLEGAARQLAGLEGGADSPEDD